MPPSIPKFPSPEVQPPLTGHVLCVLLDGIVKERELYPHANKGVSCLTCVIEAPPKHKEVI